MILINGGSNSVTERGVVYSSIDTPTLGEINVNEPNGTGTGVFANW
ncbi:MAG: hypothetical protein IPF54_11585 [Draconibacterium sp.]|nr:hypothetical protein [Draconibacterium sp.]